MESAQKIGLEKVNQLFRKEYGKIVSVLTKTFGPANINLAEDVVQEALLEATRQWSETGIPENPAGWIYKVAKNKAVNVVNQEQNRLKVTTDVAHHLQSVWTSGPALEHIFTDKEIADDQLRMMFLCCSPALSQDSQIALTLKTLCGFSIPEIANAFLTTDDTINKRLVRARKILKEQEEPFEVPPFAELEKRIHVVLETIYLLFNEGYNSTSNASAIRSELCAEAIRLCEILLSNTLIENKTPIYALQALMCLNASRFKARLESSDHLLDLEQQNRSLWDKALIHQGIRYLTLATEKQSLSLYHILATISAYHCTAPDFESTNWQGILELYNNLIEYDDSPIIHLNRAVVLAKVKSPESALKSLSPYRDSPTFKNYLPYYTTMAELHYSNQNSAMAVDFLEKALEKANENSLKQNILKKITQYKT